MGNQVLASVDLDGWVDRWVRIGIITAEQGQQLRADVAALPAPTAPSPSRPARVTSLVTEALGYLGGVIVLVGLGLVVGRYWDDLSTAARVALALTVAALLSVAGIAVPRGDGGVAIRLRSVLWLAAVAALFGGLVLLAADGWNWDPAETLVFAGGATLLASVAMWAAHRRVLQHATVLATLIITAGAVASLLVDSYLVTAMVIWTVGVGWCALAAARILRSRRTGMALGSVTAIAASLVVEEKVWGTAVALVTVVALVCVAVILRDLVLLGVASIGMLMVLPAIIVRYFPGVLSAAVTLVAVGLLLVGAAVYTARRRRPVV